MITAIKDYNSMIIKPQFAWLRKHWAGYLMFVVITYAATYLYYVTKFNQD